jgi:hypothetical protein
MIFQKVVLVIDTVAKSREHQSPERLLKQYSNNMSKRGMPCHFVRGKYAGKQGWVKVDKPATKCYTHVIVNKPAANGTFTEYHMKVRHESVRTGEVARPTNYQEAILQQPPDIEHMIDKLGKELAKCHLSHNNQAMYVLEL